MKPTTFINGIAVAACVLLSFSFFYSCQKGIDNNSSSKDSTSGTSQVEFRLTDGPGLFDAVNIDIRKIIVNVKDSTGWEQVELLRPGIYNILNFRNGLDTLLATQSLPSGWIGKIKVILGDSNTVVINGITYPFKPLRGDDSVVVLHFSRFLQHGRSYKIWLDFDLLRSIVMKDKGNIFFNPFVRTYCDGDDDQGGAIQGYVLPSAARATVTAINGSDTLMALPAANGFYKIPRVPEGSWQLHFDAVDSTNYKDSTITNVEVREDKTTKINTVILHQ